MDEDRARRAAPPPPTPAFVFRAFLRLPARQALALLPSAEVAPMEGSILGVLLSAALRRARDAPPLDGEVHLALPERADGDDVATNLVLRVAFAGVRAHRAEDPAPPMDPAFVFRAFLRLPARQALALLPSAEVAPMEGSILGVLLSAALRRARDAPPLDGEVHLALPERADGDDVATNLVLRVAFAGVRAHRAEDPAPPMDPAREMDMLLFNSLVHRARRQNPAPTEVFLLRLLLRLPAHQARRLLPPPAEPARQDRRSAEPGPGLVPILLYAGLRRLEAALPIGSEGLLRELVMVLGPLSRGLLPPPAEGDHAAVLLLLLPPAPPVERGGILSAALSLIQRWSPARRDDLLPPPGAGGDDMVPVIIRLALQRITIEDTRPARNVLRFECAVLSASLRRARGLAPQPSGAFLLSVFLRLPVHLARRLLMPPPVQLQPALQEQDPGALAEPAQAGPSFVPFLLYAGLRRRVHRQDNRIVLLLVRVAMRRLRVGPELVEMNDDEDKPV